VRYEFGGFTFDTDARLLSAGGEPVHLSGKALDLLRILIENRPSAVHKNQLHDLLWPDTHVVEASLPVLVREIRAALGDERDAIRTVHRYGYAFAGTTGKAPLAAAHLLLSADREFRLFRGENIVGRDPAAEVFIPSSTVSRHHAVITTEAGSATVADLQSKNGTRVNGVAITAPATLQDGFVVTFGSIDLTYRCTLTSDETQTAEH
jgi:DNA-binding winged helix-turn-helix (wHTH) protein